MARPKKVIDAPQAPKGSTLTPAVGQKLVTVGYNPMVESSLVRMSTKYRRFEKGGIRYLQYITADPYYHAKKA